MDKVERSLLGIGRRFIGGYDTRGWYRVSKYMPHQGKRECARRVRQMAAKAERDG